MGETIRHKRINSRLTTTDSGEYICLFDVFGFYKSQMPKDSTSLSVQKKYLQQSGRGIGNIDCLLLNPFKLKSKTLLFKSTLVKQNRV